MIERMDAEEMREGFGRLADELYESTRDRSIALVGIRRRGDEVAERLRARLAERGREVEFGTLDISLYRDDYEHLRENPELQGSDIPFEVEGQQIVLVDDVLFTGRTIRAALDAISDYGRPGRVELAVLVDRGHREFPIQPDYVGIRLPTARHDHVYVSLLGTDGEDKLEVKKQ